MHVNSSSNPADYISRCLTARDLVSMQQWITGPDWLLSGKDKWPDQPCVTATPKEAEIKPIKEVYSSNAGQEDSTAVGALLQRCSNWHRLLRIIAIILHWKDMLHKQAALNITVQNMQRAEVKILKYTQNESQAQLPN